MQQNLQSQRKWRSKTNLTSKEDNIAIFAPKNGKIEMNHES